MRDLETKKKVLEEIMSLMDEKEGDSLKMKSPKFMAAKVEIKKPDMEIDPEEEMELGSEDEEEMSPEMIEKLVKMYAAMK